MFKPLILVAALCVPAHALWGRVRIGVSLPLSGDKADRGLPILQGVQMRVDEINASGGVNGKTLELVVRDDHNNADIAGAIATDFSADSEMLGVIGDYDDEPARKALAIYDRMKMPVYFPSISNPDILRASPFAFGGTFSDDRAVETLAAYLNSIRRYKNILVIYDKGSYGTHLDTAFEYKAGNLGLKVRSIGCAFNAEQGLPDDFLDKRLTQAQQDKADAVVIFSHSDLGAPLIKQLRGRGLRSPIFGSDRLASNLYQLLGPELTDDIHIAFPFLYDFASLKGAQFRKRFRSRFGTAPSIYSAFAYDGVSLFANAIAQDSNRVAIQSILAGHDSPANSYEGVSGTLYFDPLHSMARDTVMGFLRSGQWKPCFMQLVRVVEPHTLHILPEKIKSGEVVLADGESFFKVQVIYVGVDYYRVNQVSIKDLTFESEFFLWFKWQGDADLENIGFINEIPGKSSHVELRNNFGDINKNDPMAEKWVSYKIKSTFVQPYDLHLFPFDTQRLPLMISHRNKNANKVRLIADTIGESTRTIKDIYPQEWNYVGRDDFAGTYNFQSNFGNPSYREGEIQADYSVYEADIVIHRILFPYIITLFMPLSLLLCVSLLVMLIPKEQFSPRNSLVMSALLGVLVYHMAQARSLPQVGYLMRSDFYFVIAYVFLFTLILGLNVVNLLLSHHSETAAARLDKALRYCFIIGIATAYTLLTMSAFFWTSPGMPRP